MRRALVLAVIGGCWSSSPAPAPEPVHNTAPVGPQLAERELPQHSVWRGKYTCAQGLTALELTLDVTSAGDANAIFDFGPHEGNPTIPHGSYRMIGTVKEAGPILQVRLEPDRWIQQPPSYMMVGLDADSDRARTRLTGWITNESCAALELERIE